jgi:hypothetical protein
MKKKLLITGDSFAADWTVKHQGQGWVNMLSEKYDVTNLAQAGVSEYKIIKQIQSVSLSHYDYVIISHTSPFRISVKEHPIHSNDALHSNCDLIYSDLKENEDNKLAKVGVDFFEKLYDTDYALFVHELMLKYVDTKYKHRPIINTTFFEHGNLYKPKNFINFHKIFNENRGNMNHLNEKGNKMVFDTIVRILSNR